MVNIICQCGHQNNSHTENGCNFDTCICEKFRGLLTIDDEKIEQVANKLLENIQEKLDKLEPPAFTKNMPEQVRQESAQDRQRSQSDIWDEVEAHWDKIDELTDDGEYDEVDKELDIILEIKFENISAWIKKGLNNISRRKYDDAIFCYNNALILDKKENKKLDKKDYKILNFIGRAHKYNNNYDVAINFFKASLKIKEDFVPALESLGLSYRDSDEYESAVEQFKKILSTDGNNVDALDHLGYCYECQEEYDEAIKCYNTSKDIEGKDVNDTYSDLHLANCYLQKNDFEHAEILINKQKIVENEQQYSLQIRGQIYKKMERYEEAIENYEKESFYESSSRPFKWFELGYCYTELGKTAIGLEHYKKYVELYYLTPIAAQNIGYTLSSLGKDEEAIEWYEKGLEKYPGNFGLLQNKAFSHEHLGQNEDAIKCLDKILEDTPEHLPTLFKKCKLLVKVGKITEGIEGLELIQSKNREEGDPPAEDILNHIGWSWMQKGENKKGLEYVEEALKINLDSDILDSKAVALYNLKRYAESKECYEKIFEMDGNEVDREWVGICLKEMGIQEEDNREKQQKYYEDAIKIFDLILENNKQHSDSWYHKGIINWNLNKFEDAKKCQLEAIKISPNDAYYWQELADIMKKQKKSDQAIVCFNKSIEIEQSYYAHVEIGKIFYEKKDHIKAINHFDEALKIERTPHVLIEKGNALFMIAKYEKKTHLFNDAIDCYDEAFKIDPKNSDALGNQGNTFREMKKYDDAITNLNAAIDLAPESYWAYSIKFMTYQEMGDFDNAIKFSNLLFKKFPDNEKNINNLMISLGKEMGDENMVKEYKEKNRKLKDWDDSNK